MLKIRFDTDNAAFDDMKEIEVARILRELAGKIESGGASGMFQNVHDINGNIVGTFKLD